MKAYIFAGQGSQFVGMGAELFDRFEKYTLSASQILGYSIKELCLHDHKKELGLTRYTQPAIYVVNALSYYAKLEESGAEPEYVLGHSLGEYNALLAAGCFDFESGLRHVIKRGELMSLASGGGMAAVLKASSDEIRAILAKNDLDSIDLANFNTPTQTVISGPAGDVDKAQEVLASSGIYAVPLNTSGAFHSRYMAASKKDFAQYLNKFEFNPLKIPVVSNVTARPYEDSMVRECLCEQITSPVKWHESIQYLLSLGDIEFSELGGSTILTKMIDEIRRAWLSENIHLPVKGDKGDIDHSLTPRGDATFEGRPMEGFNSNHDWLLATKNLSANEKVDLWNRRYSVGTRVQAKMTAEDNVKTRSSALILFGHRAAVYLEGYNGYFDLNEVVPI